MKNQKPSDSVSSPVSLFSPKTADEMMAMDDSEFFDFMEKELEDNSSCSLFPEVKKVSNVQEMDIRQKHLDLEAEESQQEIPTSVTLSSQLTLDPEISSLLANYPHYVRPPDLPDEVPFGTEVYFYPPMLGLDRNERLHCLDEYFEYDLPDILRTCLSCPEDDHTLESESPHIVEPMIPPETETERHVGNSFKPNRRIDICANFLKYLKISDFPFSVDQRKTFVIIDNRILGLRANYTRKDELLLKSDLDLLMNLLANTDYHPVSSTRINRYVSDLISELEFWIERDPIIPILLPGKIPFFVDPAVYLINKLLEIFPNATEEAIEKSFCAKRKEIHIKLTQLFQKSKFPFTLQQKLLFEELSVAVHATTGNPDSNEEKEFLKILDKLLHDLNFVDDGPRDGISNPKKVKREFNNFVDALIELGYEERSFLSEFELFFLNSADLIYHITKVLRFSFIPRYTFPQPRAPN